MRSSRFATLLERLSAQATRWAGTSAAFLGALGVVVVWLLSGFAFGFSETWQLVINTGTTIVTFLMVFLLQRSQNKDSQALHIKLNELLAAKAGASNRLIAAEALSETELETLRKHFAKLVRMSQQSHALTASHSIEEAEQRHHAKHARPARTRRRVRAAAE